MQLSRVEMAPGWVLDRYFGWRDRARAPGLRLLEKWRGPLRQLLLLTDGAHQDDVDAIASHQRALGPLSFFTWNDFGARVGDPPRAVAGRVLPGVAGVQWFGVGTFVLDLTASEETLFAGISRARTKEARRAEKKGVRVAVEERPPRAHVDEFLALHRTMATERALAPLDEDATRRMLDDGAAVLVRALDATSRPLVVNVVYLVGAHGYYLYGTRAGDVMDGVGHLAQWETIRFLKARGARVYDLGLVASAEDGDGIYRFKRSLGGAFLPSGREVAHVPLAVRLVRRLRR